MILVRNIRMELNDPPERLAQKAARRLGIREGEPGGWESGRARSSRRN